MTPESRLRWIAIAGDVSAFLTILAALPYELGEVATLISPDAKQWIAGIGAFATIALRLLKRFLPPADTAK